MSKDTAMGASTRREFVASVAGAAIAVPLAAASWNAASAAELSGDELPLITNGLEHVGIVVADVTRSATFYCGVFGHGLFREIDPPLRYYVMTGKAYIAIGSREGVAPKLDHYCVTVDGYNREKMDAAIKVLGYRALPRGVALDPDGIGLQLLEDPAGLTDTNIPADRILGRGYGLVQPYGMDNVVLRVSDMDRARGFYDKFFAKAEARADGEVWYHAADTVIRVAPQAAGQAPAFERYGIRVGPCDFAKVKDGIEKLGGAVEGVDGDRLYFTDPDNLKVELVKV